MSGTIATIVQQQTIADQPAGWSQTLAFNQFDPSLGTLDAVGLSVRADLNGYVALENLEAAPISVGVGQSGEIDATAGSPGFLYNYALFGAGSSANLAAYDGTADFAGSSGTVVPLSATGSGEFGSGATQDLSQAIGTGILPVSVSSDATVQINGPANLDVISSAQLGGSITLQYTYTPIGSSAHVGGGSFGSVTTGVSGVFGPDFFQNWVTTAPQTFRFADRTSGWTDSLSAKQFDPALGTLEAVNITIVADTASTVSAENLQTAAGNVQTTQTVAVSLGGAANISASPTVDVNQYLAGYDGVTDFSGTSGFTFSQSSSSETDGQLLDATSLVAFGGDGTITLPVSTASAATLDGPGNLDAELRALAGATITVSYSYLPVGVSPTADAWANNWDGGDWSNFYNWDGLVPVAGDDVAIIQTGTYAVTLDTAATIHSLVLDSPDATLILDHNLTTTGDIILDAGTIVFAGGTLAAADVILNGGEITGGTVDIDATGSIAFKGGSIVADDVVLQTGSFISGPVITPSSAYITVGTAGAFVATGLGITSSLPAGAVITTGSTYKLTTDDASFHAGASGQRIAMQGTNDRVYGGAGADTVFGNYGAWVRGGTASLLFSGGMHGNSTVIGAAGASTLYGGSGGNNVLVSGKGTAIVVAGGNDLIWGGAGNDCIAGGSATSTVTGGTGAETVFAGSAPMLVYGGTGSLVFAGGNSGGSTVLGGAGAATLFGGSGGNNILIGGAGHAVIIGGGSGDLLMAGGAAGDMLFAGAGNETLVGSASGSDMLSAGSGTDVMFAGGGADTLMAGTGVAQMVGGSGADVFVFTNGMAGGADAIWNFKQGTDHVLLANYGTDAVANALSSAVMRGGSTMITLSDNTQITFGGISHLTTGDFV